MALIYIPAVANHKLNQTQFNSKTSSVFPGVSIGEILEAGVVEKLDGRNILITFKGINIPADSEVTLNAGDKIKLKVESLSPQVILRIVEGYNPKESGVTDYLRWFRSNPDNLSQMVTDAIKQFSKGHLGKLLQYLPEEDFQKIFKLLKSLILSPETKSTNFVKDYISSLGLSTESQLRKALDSEAGMRGADFHPQTLKSFLLKLSADIHGLLTGKETLGHEEVMKLTSLSEFINSSIKTIESHQIINFILQEAENRYLFQIPILLPEGANKGDIFVEYDRESKKEGRRSAYRVMVFLTMDILGDMIIEAKLEGKRIGCLIKCTDQEICDLVSSFLEELRHNLAAAGCEITKVDCVAGSDLGNEKADYYRDRVLYTREVIDLFV